MIKTLKLKLFHSQTNCIIIVLLHHQHSGQIQLRKAAYLYAVEIYCEINY